MLEPEVTVVIPCGYRERELSRAVASVVTQDYPRAVEIILVPDQNHSSLAHQIDEVKKTQHQLRIVPSDSGLSRNGMLAEVSGASRIAAKRNAGVRAASGSLIAHLDDDNEWLPNHLSSLVAVLTASKAPAAYSWRSLHWPDGRPFVEPLYPWIKVPDLATSAYVHSELVRLGVVTVGQPGFRDSLVNATGVPILSVDSSEWLMTRKFAIEFPYVEQLDFRSVSHSLSDDFLFCRKLVESGVNGIVESREYTLRYYLGGRSNSWLLERLTS